MDIDAAARAILRFVEANREYAPLIAFAVAFGESLAVVSLLVPGTFILVGFGALIGATDISFAPIWFGAVAGAFLGDWVSYTIGRVFKHRVAGLWPLSRRPDLLPRGERFFARWGFVGVFVGRFFGPLRAVVSMAAGVASMPFLMFQTANAASALVWGALVLTPGFMTKYIGPFMEMIF